MHTNYGSHESIAAWSDDVDRLLAEIDSLRARRRNEIANERTLESAKRMLQASGR